MRYVGWIIRESLSDPSFLDGIKVLKLEVSKEELPLTLSGEEKGRWHMYKVEVTEKDVEDLQRIILPDWYAHFWGDDELIVVYSSTGHLRVLSSEVLIGGTVADVVGGHGPIDLSVGPSHDMLSILTSMEGARGGVSDGREGGDHNRGYRDRFHNISGALPTWQKVEEGAGSEIMSKGRFTRLKIVSGRS